MAITNKVKLIGQEIVNILRSLETVVGPKYQLTFIARCTDETLKDADIFMTSDSLEDVLKAIKKRSR